MKEASPRLTEEVLIGPKGRLFRVSLEASLVSRECLGRRRISSLVDLISLVAAWRLRAEEEHRVIDWRFRVDDARRVFRYEGLTARRSEH
jgi:hypothetical protein